MATKYNYKISTDFGGSLNTRQLQDEIEADAGIPPTCNYIETYGDDVDVWFDIGLSEGEETILGGLVSAHTPGNAAFNTPIPFTPLVPKVSTSSYTMVGSMIFPNTGNIGSIDFISYKDSSVTSYDIQIIDKNNNNIIATKNITNSTPSVQTISTNSNQPSGVGELQISMKITKNGNAIKYAYVNSGMFWIEQ